MAMEKTEKELRAEIRELHRQQREITERIRDPRGLRRRGLVGNGARNFGPEVGLQRGFVRPADRREDFKYEPAPKRRLSSAVVKVEEGEVTDGQDTTKEVDGDSTSDSNTAAKQTEKRSSSVQQNNRPVRSDGNQRSAKEFDYQTMEHTPRVFSKNDDPRLVSRNKRMLGQLLGTLEKFQKDDMKLSGSEAFMRRSTSLQRAQQKAREESERLRQKEREQIAENRRRDLMLRADVAAKAEAKKLELLFLRWAEHHKKLNNFLRTKTEPPIYYLPAKPLEGDANLNKQNKEQAFSEWNNARREEITAYQKEVTAQYVANAEKELERWQNAKESKNLQETMDKELEDHRLEHGPKTRKIHREDNEDEEDVEDINIAEDDMMDDLLGVDENNHKGDENSKIEAADANGGGE